MKAILLVSFLLASTVVKEDKPALSPTLTLDYTETGWSIANIPFPNGRSVAFTSRKLLVKVKNNFPKTKIFTSYETFLFFVETPSGQRIYFSDRGRDHSRLPNRSEFITLAPGQTGTLSIAIDFYKQDHDYGLSYECPTGECYECKLPLGTYKLGLRYRLPDDFFDGFNDPKRESFHQSWDDAKLIWNGTVDSEMMMIELKSF